MAVAIWDRDDNEPFILSASFISSTRSTATFRIETDRLGFLYYAIGDKHIPPPIFENVRNNIKNTTLSYSSPIFSVRNLFIIINFIMFLVKLYKTYSYANRI